MTAAASAWVVRFAPLLLPGGEVLDLACGRGRHLRFLRGRGHPVVGIDRDLSGVADLRGAEGIELREKDLEDGSDPELGRGRFAGIVVANYLHRPLLSALGEALAPDGLLIYETFARGNEAFGRPTNPDFLLQPGELLEACAGLHVVAYEHGYVSSPGPAIVQRICALRPGTRDLAACGHLE